ncbi:hypothetical protein A7X88_02755 [Stenotrophomonas maltophilia]|uniref:hypothetical protein n=1 Tax=Stenotrophomonas maltophilia TaxID=40324 RepID=UPI000DAAB6FA|nr:hypothetical protein [Stenotrophomonas maltophilia]PZT22693.1 hypothetical protein A7X88_02755 [Stenotrophomonas maltophilia]
MAILSLGVRQSTPTVATDSLSAKVVSDLGAARLLQSADEAERYAGQLLEAAKQLRAAQHGAAA